MRYCYVLARQQDANKPETYKDIRGVFYGPAKIARQKALVLANKLLRSEFPLWKDKDCSSSEVEIYWSKNDMYTIEKVKLYKYHK